MKKSLLFIIFILSFISNFASNKQDSLKALSINILPNREFIINSDIDLHGKVLLLPKGVTLNFKYGVFKNGVIIGNYTKIKCKKQAFDNIEIKGSWNVAQIYSTWFKDLSYVNALQNVIALTNPKVKNKVVISMGNYLVKVDSNGQSCLSITDNTELVLNGSIRLLPNSFTNYDIIDVAGNDVKITGSGTIYGDKHTHTGSTGEWGMGINLKRATNVSISGLTIKDCWGDCIYIGTNSENVLVENCTLDHGRRQGISVTSGKHIIIRNLKIMNVSGTSPEYGIDVEPNTGGIVDNVIIDNVTIDNCQGGIKVYGKRKRAYVGLVIVKECKIINTSKTPIHVKKCKEVKVLGCEINNFLSKKTILCEGVEKVIRKNNIIKK